MKRRQFLKTTVAGAGVLTLGSGCPDDTSPPAPSDTTTSDGVDAGPEPDVPPTPDPIDDSPYFPQSVASGDPREDSVILWTRVADGDHPDEDATLRLELAMDEGFESLVTLDGESHLDLLAEAAFSHCVRVKVTGLTSATTYYYRFIYDVEGVAHRTVVGRTKTAPAAGSDVGARFAVVSCQDYAGRYYNTYKHLLASEPDLDFIVHLGDYVYETTGDPAFQTTDDEREVYFRDVEGAIAFGEGTDTVFYAARSLDNYRQLYQTYRTDPVLQAVHARYPMVIIWDDHEFSDDSHGAHGTYLDGAADELDVQRRKNANQAWFEYMPVDYMAADFRYDAEAEFPGDLVIYRDLPYGDHLHLVLTDLRTWRSDHVIPEDAFPGAVFALQAELEETFDAVPDVAVPYVEDITTYEDGAYQSALLELGHDAADLTGPISAAFITSELTTEEGEAPAIAAPEVLEALPRGLAWHQLGKRDKYSNLGARYFIIDESFLPTADYFFAKSDGASEVAMGEAQRDWFLDTMTASDRTWKVWGNEFCLLGRGVDLSPYPLLPDAFRKLFRLSAEDWDGMPNRRDAFLEALADVPNVVAVTGDIHAFFASLPGTRADAARGIVEFVTGAISSSSYKRLVMTTAQNDPTLLAAGAPALALIAEELLMDPDARPNPHLGYAQLDHHGFMVVDVDSARMEVSFHAVGEVEVSTDITDLDALAEKFSTERFRVLEGEHALYRWVDETWKRWDIESLSWVEG